MGETVADKTSKILAFVAVGFGVIALILCCVGVGTTHWLCNFCNRYLVDDHKLRQPTEKKNYTLCPYYVTHHPLAHVSEVTLTEAESSQAKSRWQTFVRTISAYPSNKYYGRGIVSSASSGFDRCRRLIASIKLLRWMGCRLPVEVFMYPGELRTDEIREFETVPGVTVRILKHNISQINSKTGSFAIKPASILHSSFEHVLWLDSDNIAVRDPEYLFDLPHYTRSTAMFWPDFWSTPGKNAIWKILDMPCRAGEYEQESYDFKGSLWRQRYFQTFVESP
ncbi:unnamed protein product [Adineta steineri]|uniref:Uncharacterized protein n=1 Tax=Adineta steineri TaxID=433720 RepID=A0A819W1Y4_9BILA|nr:unnamed protein product [Adineta steineri]CAF4117576.1 unnamed protein product [Adineta steineri]